MMLTSHERKGSVAAGSRDGASTDVMKTDAPPVQSGTPWKNLILVAASLLASLLVAEAFFRFYAPLPGNLPTARRTKHWDQELGFVFKPGSEFKFWKWNSRGEKIFESTQVINAWGFADQPVPDVWPEDGLRIMILGDSFAEALQVEMDEKLGALLERSLGAAIEVPVEVSTLGRSGTGQATQYSSWRKYRDVVRPQILVLMLVSNDIRDNHPELSARYTGMNPLHPPRPYFMLSDSGDDGLFEIPLDAEYRKHRESMLPLPRRNKQLSRHSALLRYLQTRRRDDTIRFGAHRVYKGRHVDYAMFEYSDDAVPRNAREITRRVLAKFARECRERNIHLVLLVAKGAANLRALNKDIMTTFDGWVKEWAQELEVDYLSVYQESLDRNRPFSELSLKGDGHWNSQGHLFAAELLGDHVTNMVRAGRVPGVSLSD